MELRLDRRPASSDGTILGVLFVDGAFQAFTLERTDVAIPLGRYPITITPSQKFGRMLPLVNEVPGREGIRIHPGNSEIDTEGCILVGQRIAGESVAQSRDAMDQLQPLIARALANHDEVWLTVQDAPQPGSGSA